MRFPLEVFDAVRAAVPADLAVSMRVSGTDWTDGGWDIDQTIAFARALEARGCAAMHVSSGGLTSAQQIPVGPSYQVPLARAVKKATRMPVIAIGLITEFEQAEAIVGTGDADLIALARTSLQPALAVACRCTFRCASESARPVSEIATSAISRPFRHRALRLRVTREWRRASVSQVDWPAGATGVIPTLLLRKSGMCRQGGYRTREEAVTHCSESRRCALWGNKGQWSDL
jgi:tRNA-dihydrouridine synthase